MTQSKTAAVLFTGGKDSMRTIELMLERGYDISCLVTMISDNEDSYMLHTAAIEVTRLSAKALGIPLFVGRTAGIKEKELEDIYSAIREVSESYSFDTLASGGIASVYQRDRISSLCQRLGLKTEAPLWGVDQPSYLKDLVLRNYQFILTSVSAEGLDRSWLGREINGSNVEEIIGLARKNRFNPSFEGGEAETLVLDCPLFKSKKLKILKSEINWRGSCGRLLIKDAVLVPKKRQEYSSLA